jgi:Tol biopolymer transport system component
VGLVAGGAPVRVTNDTNLELRPRWSPDGSRLAFGRLDETGRVDVWVVPALGGDARRILTSARFPAWSPDGRQLAYASGGVLWLSDATGANARAATRPEPSTDSTPITHSQPSWSHDGRSLAFVRRRDGPYSELALLDLATGVVRELTADGALAQSPAWSADDRFVYFCSSRGGALNVWKLSPSSGDLQRVTAGVGDDAEIDVSSDGHRLVFATYRSNKNLAEVSLRHGPAASPRWLTADLARGEHVPSYSPDGRQISYTSSLGGTERESIWVMDADGRNAKRIVADERVNVVQTWAGGDGDLVYFSRAPGIAWQAELRRVPVGGGAPERLALQPWSPSWGDVAADGRLLVRVAPSKAQIVDLDSRAATPAPDVGPDPSWSPDGRSIAYLVGGDDKAGLWTVTLEGTRRRWLEGWIPAYAWGPSGDLLAIVARPDCTGSLWRVALNGRRSLVLDRLVLVVDHQVELVTSSWFDVHPDDSRIAIEALESFEADITLIDSVR